MRTQIEILSQWIHSTSFQAIPEDVVALGRLQFIDCLSAIYAGYQSEAGQKIYDIIAKNESDGVALIPCGKKASLTDSIYYHSAMINALELDNFTFIGHISQSAFSVSYGLGVELGASFEEIIRALIIGNEVGGRISAYMVTGPHQGHMRAFAHRCAGATSAACLLKLDEYQTAHAISIALSMPEFPLYPAAFSPETKVICTSSPSVEGYRAAVLASRNFDAALDIIENPEGFWSYFTYMNYIPDIWGQVGKTWAMYALSIKSQASCAYAQSGIVAVQKAMKGIELDIESISYVELSTSMITIIMEAFSKPHYKASITPVNTQFSTKRSVSAAILFGSIDGKFYANGNFDRHKDQIEKLAKKVKLVHDWTKTVRLLKGFDAGLTGGGKPGVLGMGQTGKTLRIMKKSFGSRKLVGISDIPQILSLKRTERRYFFKRYWKGMRSKFPFFSKGQKEFYRSYEDNLNNIRFHLASSVKITLKSGEILSGEQDIPPGFAGDKNRSEVGLMKFVRETSWKIRPENQDALIKLIIETDILNWKIGSIQNLLFSTNNN